LVCVGGLGSSLRYVWQSLPFHTEDIARPTEGGPLLRMYGRFICAVVLAVYRGSPTDSHGPLLMCVQASLPLVARSHHGSRIRDTRIKIIRVFSRIFTYWSSGAVLIRGNTWPVPPPTPRLIWFRRILTIYILLEPCVAWQSFAHRVSIAGSYRGGRELES
jgi:hypothetical protein